MSLRIRMHHNLHSETVVIRFGSAFEVTLLCLWVLISVGDSLHRVPYQAVGEKLAATILTFKKLELNSADIPPANRL